MKPFSESCEQNKSPILSVLCRVITNEKSLLEIGSGTGQHAAYFANEFPALTWITSDQAQYHQGINLWLAESDAKNIQGPLLLDVNQPLWPVSETDIIFSANTVHIMSWRSVVNLFTGLEKILNNQGLFILYGPFNYEGQFTSESNARFDIWLKQRNPQSGVRDFEALQVLAQASGLRLIEDFEMPANNRILVWKKIK
ncbi:MAG: DUF938 domain-containing protein [Woeseiaceae bacterium]